MGQGLKSANARSPGIAHRHARARPAGVLLFCGLALAASGLARAQLELRKGGAEVELYGIIDVGIGTLEHSYAGSDVFASTVNPFNLNSSPRSFTGMFSGGISMSRVGVRGSAELGSGFRAFFTLESAINATSGVIANNGKSIYDNLNAL
ncbi:MAG TPA: porin, partial [Steroidobacteraceae bacterium]|nr:porin [Steroidobacteraceae bacterium]